MYQIIFNKNENNLEEKQKDITSLYLEAGVSSLKFNQGSWILGNQLAGNYLRLKNILKDRRKLQDAIKSKIAEYERYIEIFNSTDTIFFN